jgi:uncharacterized membrane protein
LSAAGLLTLTGLYAATGVLLASVAAPLWAGWVPPNNWYGFRTARTLSDKRLWYLANRTAGRDLFWAGLIITTGALLLFIARRRMPYPLHWADLILLTAAISAAVLHSFWALARY